MDNENKKQEPWRILVGIAAIGWIVYLWVKKDILEIYATMPQEQVLPMIATSVAVSLAKVAAPAGGILLIKWIAGKLWKKGRG